MNYKLISFDMDGTLLNSKKEVNQSTKKAITLAKNQGKEIVICTGRGISELEFIVKEIPEIRYICCLSGALVYDFYTKRIIYKNYLSIDTIKEIAKIASKEDAFIHLLDEKSYIQKDQFNRIEEFHMDQFKPMYRKVCIQKDDLLAFYNESPFELAKFNIYHKTQQDRQNTMDRLEAANLPIEVAIAEFSALEVNSIGVDKGEGLIRLCNHLGIKQSEMIVVGDSNNDLGAFAVAGLAIGMGNSNQDVREVVDVLVDDCDHDGCKQAIEQYLLK